MRVNDGEIFDNDIGDVPEYEWHRPPRLSVSGFRCIPGVSVAINPPCSIAIDGDIATGDHEAGSVALELDGIGVVPPVVQVIGELTESTSQL